MATAPQVQPDPDLQTGLQFLRAGLFDRAEPLFRSAHGRYGDRPEILHYLAVCLSQRGALGDAEALWRKAIAKDPNEPMLSYNLGLVARRLGKLDEAAKRFRDTIRRAPTHIEARLALAGIHIDQHRFAAAERELSEVVANLDRALEQPDGRAAAPDAGAQPQHAGPRPLSPRPLRAGARDPRAGAGAMPARTLPRRAQILGDRALALGGLGRHDEAIAEAEQALALAPQSASLNHVLGFVLYFAGRVSDAIAPIQKALELDPTFTPALQDARAGPDPPPARPTRPSTCCSGPCARIRSIATPCCSFPSCISRRERFAAGAARRWSPISRPRPTMCGPSTTRAWRCAA